MSDEDIGIFQGEEINFADAYHDARQLMGLRTTDMDALYYHVGLLYLNTPDKWVDPYLILMEEIQLRIDMLQRLAMGMV